MIKKTYKIIGMDCTACATAVEVDLEDLGINAKCSYASQQLDVEFDPNKTNESEIKKIIKTSGYKLS